MMLARIEALYRRNFREPRRERMFLASLSFFVAFALTRLFTHAFRRHGYRGLLFGDTHVHHLVWGIALLLVVGYVGLVHRDTGERASAATGRLLAVLYGVGAALTLDEFALWLNLEDVYWERQGRASIDVVILFGALISVGLWGKPFFRALGRQLARAGRRVAHTLRRS
jgi:hypothetical protein